MHHRDEIRIASENSGNTA